MNTNHFDELKESVRTMEEKISFVRKELIEYLKKKGVLEVEGETTEDLLDMVECFLDEDNFDDGFEDGELDPAGGHGISSHV